MKLGVFDIGTNSIHMILADLHKDFSIDVLDRAKEFTRLGESTFVTGKLSADAISRGLEAVRRFKKLAEIRRVHRIKAVATSAVREASNGGDFIDKIEKETGIKVKVITGEEEARLIGLAVHHSITLPKTPCAILDIGGGSVEIIITREKEVLHNWSFKLGTLRLREVFIKSDPPNSKEIEKLEKHISQILAPALEEMRKLKVHTLIGTSGTLINLVSMAHLQQDNAPIESSNNFRLPAKDLKTLHSFLIDSDLKSRIKIRGMDPHRADIIIPGSTLVNYLIEEGNIEEVILCDAAIREGMMYDYMEKNRSKLELESLVPDIRMRSVLQLARKCDYRPAHAQHVCDLTLCLFDQMKSLHRMSVKEREWLTYAALLHDIGYHISYKKHHRHTYYLITNADLTGFEEKEIKIIANIARYHAKSLPKKTHENLQDLSPEERKSMTKCAAILRLVDALDRSHFSVIDSIRYRLSGKKVFLDLYHRGDPELEMFSEI
jgi:exopolyphosphatase/guanosine-5'-triphosphate,3'-diphosphate pyrophosphatase